MQAEVGQARRRAGAIGATIVVIALLLVARPAAGDDEHGMGIVPPGEWTAEQEAFMVDLVHRTEEALPAFADIPTIESLGFFDFGAVAPGGYYHWINPSWIDDGHILDPEFPESLVFRATDDGGFELQAAMFVLDSGTDMSNIPDDIAFLPGWHQHPDLCVDDSGRFTGIVFDGECASGHPDDSPPMVHSWIVDNECGHRFASIDIQGVICDVSHGHDGHGGDHGDDGDHGDHGDHGGDDHGGHDDGMDDHHQPPAAPPANPIHTQPHHTG